MPRTHELKSWPDQFQAMWIGQAQPPETTSIDVHLREGDKIAVGQTEGSVLHTPGHTQGSICIYFANAGGKLLFAGDTLFQGSIGRTDLPGGDTRQIFQSLRDKVLALDDETRVIPGHGPVTTIGDERETNPFLQDL